MPGAARLPDGSPRALLPVPGALTVLDVPAVRRWALLTRSVFAARRIEIDALNVFPVPDGDTGTNLFLTFDGAVERLLTHDPHGAGDLLAAFAKALLWTARGNSGVILSQLARGLAEACADAEVVDGPLLARGLVRAEERARQAVTDPQEGTILSVATAMATAAVEAAEEAEEAEPGGPGGRTDTGLYAVSLAALDAARVALERTPQQLEVLARAGVVDAGGAGLVILLECLERICSGQRGRPSGDDPPGRRGRYRTEQVGPPSAARPDDALHHHVGDDSPAYEVMYLLADSDEEAVALLRHQLVELGDSVLVVGGDGEWNIHAHVDDAGAAIEAGIVAGRPHRVRITRLDRDIVPLGHEAEVALHAHEAARHTGSAIVACAAGDGLAALFGEAGAAVVPSGPGRRASTGALIAAIRAQHATGAAGVVVLPNDGDTLLAAAAAARAVADDGIDAQVVRARTAVQGLAALAVFEPGAAPSANVLAMQSASSATRHGAVTVANRAALTSAGPCEPGDVLGVVDGDIVVVGSDEVEVGREVVRRLLASGGELVTVVIGAGAGDGLGQALAAEATAQHRGVEVSQIDGGQPVYSVLVGVE
ncbi:MAG TPA: DAK2 domain-containing protein [Humibacillus xanthopallidus]|nr:DAK2 domain-containing protein [Humibacillus xanthopallidus]